MKIIALATLLAAPLAAQQLFRSFVGSSPSTVLVTGVTAQQAAITYTATSSAACTVTVSTSPSLSPVVYDLDPNTFTNANLDLDRASTLTSGLVRSAVIGQRAAQYASAGTYSGVRHFSRSLASMTTYYGQIGGSGCSTTNFTFATSNIPLGQVYGDPWLYDPAHPGDQPWPETVGGTTTESYNEPVQGAFSMRVGLRGNQPTQWISAFGTGFNQGQVAPCDSAGPWTNPCGSIVGGSGSTTVGNSTAPMILRLPVTNRAPWTTNYNSGFSLDQFGVTLTGSTASTHATLDACLSMNGGQSCASIQKYQATVPSSSGPIVFGTANYNLYGACGGQYPCWLLDSSPRINAQETIAHQGTGTITDVSGTYYIQNTGGDNFSLYWITGGAGTIRISTVSQADACASPPASSSATEYRIASFTDPTGAGLNGNYLALVGTPATGSVYWCENNWALMVWRDVADSITVTLTASSTTAIGSYEDFIPDNGAGTACFNTLVYGGYYCLWQSMVWINPTTGASVYYGQPVSSDNGGGTATITNSWFRTTAPMAESAVIDQTQSNMTFYLTGQDNCYYVGGGCATTDTQTSGPLVIQVVFTPNATPTQPTAPQLSGQIFNAPLDSTTAYSGTWGNGTDVPFTMTWTNLTPQVTSTTCLGVSGVGCGIVQQMKTFDSTFVPSQFDQGGTNWTCDLSAAQSNGIYLLDCVSYNGDSPGWVIAFYPGDRNPAHAGQGTYPTCSPFCGPQIIGAINTFNTPKGAIAAGQAALTGHNLHTIVESGDTGWVMIDANETPPITSSNTSIPSSSSLCSSFSPAVTAPAGATCIAIQMIADGSSATKYEPYFQSPGIGFLGTPGELRTTQLGDTACFSSSATSCNWVGQANELMTLRAKTYNGTPGLFVFSRSTYGHETSLSGSPYYLRWESYQSTMAVCANCGSGSQAVQVWWNPVSGCSGSPDPHGNCLQQDPNISIGHGEYRSGAESVTLNVPVWELPSIVIGAQPAWPGDWQVISGAVPSFFSLSPANEVPPSFSPCPSWFGSGCSFTSGGYGAVAGVNFVNINPPFDGVFGTPFAGDSQTHPNAPGVNASSGELTQAFDNVVETGESSAPNFSLVSGQLYRHRPAVVTDPDDFYSGASAGTPASGGIGTTYINRKIMATAASCGNHPLIDVSGPSSVIGSTSAYMYQYCHSRVANECVSGSQVADLYANCPGVTVAGSGGSGVGCNAGSYHPGTPFGVGNDICIQNRASVADSITQYTLAQTDYYGAKSRQISGAGERLRMVTNTENNANLPNNSWIMYRGEFLNLDRQDLWMAQYPSYPATDSFNRGTFIPISVSFTPPGGTNNTVVDFGYQEYAQSGVPYCTTRLDACEAIAESIPTGYQPFKFASETPIGIACASGPCSITIPAISQRMLYYRLRYQNSGGGTLSTGPWQVTAVP